MSEACRTNRRSRVLLVRHAREFVGLNMAFIVNGTVVTDWVFVYQRADATHADGAPRAHKYKYYLEILRIPIRLNWHPRALARPFHEVIHLFQPCVQPSHRSNAWKRLILGDSSSCTYLFTSGHSFIFVVSLCQFRSFLLFYFPAL